MLYIMISLIGIYVLLFFFVSFVPFCESVFVFPIFDRVIDLGVASPYCGVCSFIFTRRLFDLVIPCGCASRF